jgi:maltooligosyltrehalose trehalohydrolase
VIYELHVGTFSPECTFEGARARLDHLASLGVTHVELMPVAEFSGDRGWGYDGVDLFAPRIPARWCSGGSEAQRRRAAELIGTRGSGRAATTAG